MNGDGLRHDLKWWLFYDRKGIKFFLRYLWKHKTWKSIRWSYPWWDYNTSDPYGLDWARNRTNKEAP
jgi:hypothetical protein